MIEEHVNQEDLMDYVLRNEYISEPESIIKIEKHLKQCPTCANRYELFKDRYLKLRSLAPPQQCMDEINRLIAEKHRHKPVPGYIKAAACIAFIVITYGSGVWWVNYRFDHSATGLAELKRDYTYAIEPEYIRGGKYIEPSEINDFKKGVRLLFESKETYLGLFPSYNEQTVNLAESYFQSALKNAQDELLIKKCRQYLEKIELIKKEHFK